MKDLIKKWWNKRKQQLQLAHRDNICNQFYVNERSGELYILCNGVAIKQMAPDSTAQDICDIINTMRTAAVKYDNNGAN